MTPRYLISQDSPLLYITLVAKNRLPVFRTDSMKKSSVAPWTKQLRTFCCLRT